MRVERSRKGLEILTRFGRDLGFSDFGQSFLQFRIDEGVRVDDAEDKTVDRETTDHNHPGPEAAVGRAAGRVRRFARTVVLIFIGPLSAQRICPVRHLHRHRVLRFVHFPRLPDRRIDCHWRATLAKKGVALTRIRTVGVGLTTLLNIVADDWTIDRSCRAIDGVSDRRDIDLLVREATGIAGIGLLVYCHFCYKRRYSPRRLSAASPQKMSANLGSKENSGYRFPIRCKFMVFLALCDLCVRKTSF